MNGTGLVIWTFLVVPYATIAHQTQKQKLTALINNHLLCNHKVTPAVLETNILLPERIHPRMKPFKISKVLLKILFQWVTFFLFQLYMYSETNRPFCAFNELLVSKGHGSRVGPKLVGQGQLQSPPPKQQILLRHLWARRERKGPQIAPKLVLQYLPSFYHTSACLPIWETYTWRDSRQNVHNHLKTDTKTRRPPLSALSAEVRYSQWAWCCRWCPSGVCYPPPPPCASGGDAPGRCPASSRQVQIQCEKSVSLKSVRQLRHCASLLQWFVHSVLWTQISPAGSHTHVQTFFYPLFCEDVPSSTNAKWLSMQTAGCRKQKLLLRSPWARTLCIFLSLEVCHLLMFPPFSITFVLHPCYNWWAPHVKAALRQSESSNQFDWRRNLFLIRARAAFRKHLVLSIAAQKPILEANYCWKKRPTCIK